MDFFDVRDLLSEEEMMVQDTVARFTDEKSSPSSGKPSRNTGSRRSWFPRSPPSDCWGRRSTASTAPG
jgi:hypothetical protein